MTTARKMSSRLRDPSPRPSPEMLKRLLAYDLESGSLTWLPRTPELCSKGNKTAESNCASFNSRFAGRQAFTATRCGYRVGSIFDVMYEAHRVIWAMCCGDWPDGYEIDHINGVRLDNRLSNLRKVTRSENTKNKGIRARDLPLGVYRTPSGRRFFASVTVNDSTRHLGTFDKVEDAVAVRAKAEVELGFHPNHGRILTSESAA